MNPSRSIQGRPPLFTAGSSSNFVANAAKYTCPISVYVFLALAHPTPLLILSLLKTPSKSFPVKNNPDKDLEGICVREMQIALDISQSTTSQHHQF